MLAPSRLSKRLLALLLVLNSSSNSFAADALPDPLLKYRTGHGTHGLYEIREVAMAFIRNESVRTKKRWWVGDPDIRIQVPECGVPLHAKWSTEAPKRIVVVKCIRTVSGAAKKNWEVDVPVGLVAK